MFNGSKSNPSCFLYQQCPTLTLTLTLTLISKASTSRDELEWACLSFYQSSCCLSCFVFYFLFLCSCFCFFLFCGSCHTFDSFSLLSFLSSFYWFVHISARRASVFLFLLFLQPFSSLIHASCSFLSVTDHIHLLTLFMFFL